MKGPLRQRSAKKALGVLTSECGDGGFIADGCVEESIAKLILQFDEFDCEQFISFFIWGGRVGVAAPKSKLEDL